MDNSILIVPSLKIRGKGLYQQQLGIRFLRLRLDFEQPDLAGEPGPLHAALHPLVPFVRDGGPSKRHTWGGHPGAAANSRGGGGKRPIDSPHLVRLRCLPILNAPRLKSISTILFAHPPKKRRQTRLHRGVGASTAHCISLLVPTLHFLGSPVSGSHSLTSMMP